MKNMADVLQEAGTAYSSWAPEFIPDFWWGLCSSFLLSFLCWPIMCFYIQSFMVW